MSQRRTDKRITRDLAAKVKNADLAAKALDLKLNGGFNLTEIATQLGLRDRRHTFWLLQQAFEQRKPSADLVERMRCEENAKLNALEHTFDERIAAGDVSAGDLMLRIMARRAKLNGLDAPVKTELSGPGGGPIRTETAHDDLIGRLASIASRLRAGAGDPEPDGAGG